MIDGTTVRVPLSRGYEAIIDADDAERVLAHKWCISTNKGGFIYVVRGYRVNGRHCRDYLHRFIMDAEPGQIVDHIDRDRLNNTRANLRFCSQRENVANSGPTRTNRSGYKGVSWRSGASDWEFRIARGSKYLVRQAGFKTPEEAARAYDHHARIIHGEFAYLNFPDLT